MPSLDRGDLTLFQVLRSPCWDLLCSNSSLAIAASARSMGRPWTFHTTLEPQGTREDVLRAFCLNVSCWHFYISTLNQVLSARREDSMTWCAFMSLPHGSKHKFLHPQIPKHTWKASCLHMTLVPICMNVLLQVLQGTDTKMKCTENSSEEISVKENEEEVRKGGKRCQSMVYVWPAVKESQGRKKSWEKVCCSVRKKVEWVFLSHSQPFRVLLPGMGPEYPSLPGSGWGEAVTSDSPQSDQKWTLEKGRTTL